MILTPSLFILSQKKISIHHILTVIDIL